MNSCNSLDGNRVDSVRSSHRNFRLNIDSGVNDLMWFGIHCMFLVPSNGLLFGRLFCSCVVWEGWKRRLISVCMECDVLAFDK